MLHGYIDLYKKRLYSVYIQALDSELLADKMPATAPTTVF